VDKDDDGSADAGKRVEHQPMLVDLHPTQW
jgi:hypothetical protein